MPTFFGSQQIDQVFYGNTEISQIYYGSTKVFQKIDHGLILLNKNTAGTYSVTIPYDCTIRVDMVGGGGGGYFGRISAAGTHIYTLAGGGSGAYITGTIDIKEGTYQAVVGSGGSSKAIGGNTTFYNQVAGGGDRGHSNKGGSGGTPTINIGTLTGTDGNKGAYKTSTGSPSTAQGGSPVYGTYGKGGDGDSSSSDRVGGSGYIKITIV